MTDAVKQFNWDETLLNQGKYREWFYKGLHHDSMVYLKQPPRMPQIKVKEKPDLLNGWFNEQPVWVDQAACKDADPVVFFSNGSETAKLNYAKPDAKWRQYCPQCPVREACLQAARDSGSVGIWGGHLFVPGPGERRKTQEFNDETLPKRGRPRKQTWEEYQKEINDRISAS